MDLELFIYFTRKRGITLQQKEMFLTSEGDKYFERNISKIKQIEEIDDLYSVYLKYMKSDMRILEVGCCNGHNLDYYRKQSGCSVYGIDPSDIAINAGMDTFSEINLSVGTADELPYIDEYFDFVIFGFCLYLVDRKVLSKVISEADRVLKDGGFIGITDFDSEIPKKRAYKHCSNVNSYKYDYSKIFLSFPQYSLIEKFNERSENGAFMLDPTQRVAAVILYKNHEKSYYPEMDEIK